MMRQAYLDSTIPRTKGGVDRRCIITSMFRPDLASIPDYVPGKVAPSALRLASNETNAQPLPSVRDAIAEAAVGINRYPDMFAKKLRDVLAAHLSSASGTTIDAGQLAIGCGSSAILQQLVLASCAAGDEVIYPWRSFEAYPIFCQVAGATRVPVPLTAAHGVDTQAIAKAVTDRTKLVMVCNPNNPTSTTISRDELVTLLEAVPSEVIVCLDEAYIEYVDVDHYFDAVPLLEQYPNLAIARTFSKVYGLAGLRVGYLLGSPEMARMIQKTAVPFSVNSLAQVAAETSLNATDELDRCVQAATKARQEVAEALRHALPDSRFQLAADTVPDSQTNFVWVNADDQAQELSAALLDAGVMTRCFAGEGVRITVTDADETAILLTAIEKAVK